MFVLSQFRVRLKALGIFLPTRGFRKSHTQNYGLLGFDDTTISVHESYSNFQHFFLHFCFLIVNIFTIENYSTRPVSFNIELLFFDLKLSNSLRYAKFNYSLAIRLDLITIPIVEKKIIMTQFFLLKLNLPFCNYDLFFFSDLLKFRYTKPDKNDTMHNVTKKMRLIEFTKNDSHDGFFVW